MLGRTTMKSLTMVLVLGVMLAACGNGTNPTTSTAAGTATTSTAAVPTTGSPATLPTPTSTPAKSPNTSAITVPSEPGPIDTGLAPLIAMAVTDLAGRLGIPEDQITPIRGELVTWPDSSLGCPEPDMVYLQVVMDGAVILLDVDGTVYRYHTGGSTVVPFLCEHPA